MTAHTPVPVRRIVIMLSGQILSDDGALQLLAQPRDFLVCADGGARHLHRLGIRPDLLVGDLDSIKPADRSWLSQTDVPTRLFPAEKNMTDSELAIELALEFLSDQFDIKDSHRIDVMILGALGSRPDHVLANQLMAARLSAAGYSVMLSDGLSRIHALTGPVHNVYRLPEWPAVAAVNRPAADHWAISAIPISEEIRGLTYTGLQYPLVDATLALGSTRGVSNELANGHTTRSFTVELQTGLMLLVITPAD